MRWVRLLLASCAALGASRVAQAAPLEVEWRAPACAREAEFRSRVRDALRREPEAVLEQRLSAQVRIEENVDKTGYILRVELGGGARQLETPSCDEAVAAAATVVALAIDPTAASPTADPAPPISPPPAAPPPAVPPPAPAPSRPASSSVVQAFVALGAGASLGEAPLPSPLVSAAVGVRWRSFGAQVEGFWLASQTALLAGDAQRGGEVGLAGGGLALCFSPVRGRWSLSACLAGQAGVWRSGGVGIANPESHHEPWLAAVGRLGGGLSLKPWLGLFLTADMVVPARRPDFKLEDLGSVYRPNRPALRLQAGPELRF